VSLSPQELEFLLLNFDAALRVRKRGQLFLWAQGELQALIPHQLLICAERLSREDRLRYRVDIFSKDPLEDEQQMRSALERSAFMKALAETCRKSPSSVWFADPGEMSKAGSPRWLETMYLAWHGTTDGHGTVASFFVLACAAPFDRERHGRYLELLVPHFACAYARASFAAGKAQPEEPSVGALLTGRQLQILRYVRQGKSNGEIGSLLDISPLTVKNHLRVVLRKLHAQNRTQAVSFGIEQRLI
jgi:transcriptional regulator EpsA